jgi:chromosome segregation ATPase
MKDKDLVGMSRPALIDLCRKLQEAIADRNLVLENAGKAQAGLQTALIEERERSNKLAEELAQMRTHAKHFQGGAARVGKERDALLLEQAELQRQLRSKDNQAKELTQLRTDCVATRKALDALEDTKKQVDELCLKLQDDLTKAGDALRHTKDKLSFSEKQVRQLETDLKIVKDKYLAYANKVRPAVQLLLDARAEYIRGIRARGTAGFSSTDESLLALDDVWQALKDV